MGRRATIVVATERDWFGDPRFGTFTVYLDGTKAGKVPPRGQLVLGCDPGGHVLRIRQWWYFSPRFDVDLAPDTVARFQAELGTGSLPRRSLRLMFAPWRSLEISGSAGHRAAREATTQP